MFMYMETSSKASKDTGKNKKEIILEFVGNVKGAHCGWEVIGSCSRPFSKHLVMCQRHLVFMVMNSLTSLPPICGCGSWTPGWRPCSRTLPLVSAQSPGNRARIPSAWIHRRTDQSLHYEHQTGTVRKEIRALRIYEMKNSNGKKRFGILALGLPPNHYPSCRSLFRANLFSICNSFTFLCKKKKNVCQFFLSDIQALIGLLGMQVLPEKTLWFVRAVKDCYESSSAIYQLYALG